jgi:hypothetical protein
VQWLGETLVDDGRDDAFSTQIVPLLEAAVENADTIVRAAGAFCVDVIVETWCDFHSPYVVFEQFLPLVASADGLSGKYACKVVHGFISAGLLLPPAYQTRYLDAWRDHSTWAAQRLFGKDPDDVHFPRGR